MSLFSTLSRTFNGLLNDAAEAVKDPSRDARQIVRELDASIDKAQNSLIEVQAQLSTQRSKRDAADDKVKRYAEGALRALKSGDEGLAREALQAQRAAETERDALAQELTQLEPALNNLKKQIDDMAARRKELTTRTSILEARQQIAQAKDTAATALGGIGGQNLSEDFSKLEEKVNLANARADARLGSADEHSGRALDEKLNALNTGPSVDDRLADLKRQIAEGSASDSKPADGA
ncbi:MAG: PspA/IM30 family protein [Janthinobacterium lividum]